MGEEISPFIFQYAGAFSEERARVTTGVKGGFSGYIDPNGKIVIKLRAVGLTKFDGGRAAIIAGGHTLIDRFGNLLAPLPPSSERRQTDRANADGT
jgi:hypothetical protein